MDNIDKIQKKIQDLLSIDSGISSYRERYGLSPVRGEMRKFTNANFRTIKLSLPNYLLCELNEASEKEGYTSPADWITEAVREKLGHC